MTRRLAISAVAAAIVLAAGCGVTSEARYHWTRQAGRTDTLIYVTADTAVTGHTGRDTALGRAVDRWNDGLTQVTLTQAESCPTGQHCIDVTAAARNGGSAAVGFNADLHMYGNGAHIVLTTDPTSQAVMDNIACHELGHALGLGHSPVEGVQGPCQDGWPTPWDLDQVDTEHVHSHEAVR